MTVSRATVGRLPIYLRYLKSLPAAQANTSATAIAKALGYGEVQVRKDLSAVSGAGKPKIGYDVGELIDHLESFLQPEEPFPVVIVGAGKLGKALLDYDGFAQYGLDIVAAFDSDADKAGHSHSGKPILPMDGFDGYCSKNHISIGIIAVPAQAAQSVCNKMLGCGIQAIWNFAPQKLNVPEGFPVENENLALSLVMLAGQLTS